MGRTDLLLHYSIHRRRVLSDMAETLRVRNAKYSF